MLRTLSFALAAGLAFVPAVAAQPAPPPAPSPVVPPTLETFVPAPYPPAAQDAEREAAVELELVIGTDGLVSDAKVVAAAGDGFDEAALIAARAFVFRPATRDGVPVAVKIRYRYVFELTPPEPAVAAAPAVVAGGLEGQVLSRDDGAPLIGVDVQIEGVDGTHTLVTDADGRFSLASLAPGSYQVRIVALEHGTVSREETVTSGEIASLIYRLDPTATDDVVEFGATAKVAAPEREITRRTIAAAEMTKMAGTRGDPLRGIELLPGIARPPGGSGAIIVRGSSPEDSAVFFEGAPIMNLYHLGGLTSFANGNLLSSIDLYAGNFSTRYGRKIGGVIEVSLRDPEHDRLHGTVDLNLLDASVLLEGPLGGDWTFAAAARRSTIDTWFGAVMPDDEVSFTAAPVYDDYQAFAVWKPDRDDRFRVMAYGMRDGLELELVESDDRDPAVHGAIGMATSAHKLQVDWFHRFANGVEHDVRVNGGYFGRSESVGADLDMDVDAFELVVRDEWRAELSPRVRLAAGLDLSHMTAKVAFRGPYWRQQEGNPEFMGAPIDSLPATVVDSTEHFFRPAIFAETTITPIDALEVSVGGRVDYFGDIDQLTVDPRATARLALGATTTLKAGAGLFHQPPEHGQAIEGLGDPDLRAISAMHYTLGVDQRIGATASLGLDGFYKTLDDLAREGAGGAGDLEQRGTGRIYGAELMGRFQPSHGLAGFVSYTLSRSERDAEGGGWRLFDHDQTHLLSMGTTWKIGGGWELGGTFRYTTGNPETPVVGSFYNADIDVYAPMYGVVNSSRSPAFHRLDVRLEKAFVLGGHPVAAYLDVQNAYNRRTREGTSYNHDYSQEKAILGLPIIPSLGVRGEL